MSKVLGSKLSMAGRKLEVFPANKKEETPGKNKKRSQKGAKDARRKGDVKTEGVKGSEDGIKKRDSEDEGNEGEEGR